MLHIKTQKLGRVNRRTPNICHRFSGNVTFKKLHCSFCLALRLSESFIEKASFKKMNGKNWHEDYWMCVRISDKLQFMCRSSLKHNAHKYYSEIKYRTTLLSRPLFCSAISLLQHHRCWHLQEGQNPLAGCSQNVSIPKLGLIGPVSFNCCKL